MMGILRTEYGVERDGLAVAKIGQVTLDLDNDEKYCIKIIHFMRDTRHVA